MTDDTSPEPDTATDETEHPIERWHREWKPRHGFVALDRLRELLKGDPDPAVHGDPEGSALALLATGRVQAFGHTLHVSQPIPAAVWGHRAWVIKWDENVLHERRLSNATHQHFKVEVPASVEQLLAEMGSRDIEGEPSPLSKQEAHDAFEGARARAVEPVTQLGDPEITRVESDALPGGYFLRGLLIGEEVLAFQTTTNDGSWYSPMVVGEAAAIGHAWRHKTEGES